MTNGKLLTRNSAVLGTEIYSVSYFNVGIRYVQYQWHLFNPPYTTIVDKPTFIIINILYHFNNQTDLAII
jgi:hypothetical protein